MQSAIAESSPRNRVERSRAGTGNKLLHLSTPVIEEIMMVKAGINAPSNDLRRTIDGLLKDMEVRGQQLGYTGKQLETVKFALAAFVDETVLTADFPLREEWEKYPLQLEYVGEHLAGLTFYDRLDNLMKNAQGESDIDVVEVLYLSLLLGYKGKYNIYYEQQHRLVVESVAEYLRRANRLRISPLSPHWKVTDQPAVSEKSDLPAWVKIGGGAVLGFAILIYLIFSFLLNSDVNAAREQLLR
jgi:type VI secretion system protein ImpK